MKQEVNLYQVGSREKKISWIGFAFIFSLLGLIIVLSGISFYTKAQSEDWNSKLQAAKKQKKDLREQVQKLEQKVSTQDYTQLRQRIQKLSAKKKAREKLLELLSKTGSSQEQGFAPFLEVLARQKVSSLWLTEFRIDLQGEPTLYLKGKTMDSERIPEYLLALSEEKLFSGYTFEKLSADRLEDPSGVISFTLATKQN